MPNPHKSIFSTYHHGDHLVFGLWFPWCFCTKLGHGFLSFIIPGSWSLRASHFWWTRALADGPSVCVQDFTWCSASSLKFGKFELKTYYVLFIVRKKQVSKYSGRLEEYSSFTRIVLTWKQNVKNSPSGKQSFSSEWTFLNGSNSYLRLYANLWRHCKGKHASYTEQSQ